MAVTMTSVDTSSFSVLESFVAPLWVELTILLLFAVSFALLRTEFAARLSSPRRPGGKLGRRGVKQPSCEKHEAIDKACNRGRKDDAVAAWRAIKDQVPTPVDTWKAIIQALVEEQAATDKPANFVQEVIEHLEKHAQTINVQKSSAVALDVLARSGHVTAMDALWQALQAKNLGVLPNPAICEALLGGYAASGDERKVEEVMQDFGDKNGHSLTARGFSLTIKGYLRRGMTEAALHKVHAMRENGFTVPYSAVTQLLRARIEAGLTLETFDDLEAKAVEMPEDALGLVLSDCVRRNDVDLAYRIQQLATSKGPLPMVFCEPLLKLYSARGDGRAFDVLEHVKASSIRPKEGWWIALFLRCSDSKFVRLAEELADFLRSRRWMSLALYSALMKVYGASGMYDKACGLYDQLTSEGLTPDSTMYGCLMRFAAESGNTGLTQKLFEKAPSPDIQGFMSQFRAAARNKDLDRGLAVFRQLKSSGIPLDAAATSIVWNSLLDVCVSTGDMGRARKIFEEIRASCAVNVVTYNVLLKGYCTQRDVTSAKEVLVEMQAAGVMPNDISYNSLINAAASSGDFSEAWSLIEAMERQGVPVDKYTVATMLKSLKHARHAERRSDVTKALGLLDRAGFGGDLICKDEILLCTVLDICIWFREHRRLEMVLAVQEKCAIRPLVQTYGSLIKAHSFLQRFQRCQELWVEMTELHGLAPTDIVFGCMLDALVCNHRVEEAVDLFRKWEGRGITMNEVTCSTLLKGFATSRQPERAMDLWYELHKKGTKMNTVVYNTVIDSQARHGAMDKIEILFRQMIEDGCSPNTITFSMVIKGYCTNGELDKALGVLENMKATGLSGDTIIYNNIMDCAIRVNRYPVVESLLKEMDRLKVQASNFTVAILVKMWGRRRELDKAFEVFESLPTRFGFTPNVASFMAVMSACVFNQQIDRGVVALRALKDALGADGKAYGLLITGACRSGKLDVAASLVEEAYGLGRASPGMSGQNSRLDTHVLHELFDSLLHRRYMDSIGMPLLQKMRAAQVPVDGAFYAQFLNQASQYRQ